MCSFLLDRTTLLHASCCSSRQTKTTRHCLRSPRARPRRRRCHRGRIIPTAAAAAPGPTTCPSPSASAACGQCSSICHPSCRLQLGAPLPGDRRQLVEGNCEAIQVNVRAGPPRWCLCQSDTCLQELQGRAVVKLRLQSHVDPLPRGVGAADAPAQGSPHCINFARLSLPIDPEELLAPRDVGEPRHT